MLGRKAQRCFNVEDDDRRENSVSQQTAAFLTILKEITQAQVFLFCCENVIHNSFFPCAPLVSH